MRTTLHKPEIITEWCEESGITRGDIATAAGISRWTLWRMEQGKNCPIETILGVATALNKRATDALTDEALKKFASLCKVA